MPIAAVLSMSNFNLLNYQLRSAKAGDLAAVLTLYRALKPSSEPVSGVQQRWREILGQPQRSVLVVEDGESVIATAQLGFVKLPNGHHGAVIMEYAMQLNIASPQALHLFLLRGLVHEAKQNQCQSLWLASAAQQAERLEDYRTIGFSGDLERGLQLQLAD